MAGRMHPGKQPSEQNKTKFVLVDAYAMLTTAVVPHKAPAHPNASNCIKDALKNQLLQQASLSSGVLHGHRALQTYADILRANNHKENAFAPLQV